MLKQPSSRMKKVLAILLVVFFVVSLTAVSASAAHRHGGGTFIGTVADTGTVAGAMIIGIIIGGLAITTPIVTGC
jgi:hypothetical protein